MERVLSRRMESATSRSGPGLMRRLALWLDLWSERRALERLDDHLLNDIGVTPHEARAEAERPMWDVPERRQGY